jgi:hypothetical protein
MIGLKEKAGVLPEVELDNYPSVLSGVARIDVDPSSGTVRVVPSVVVDSCLSVPDGALPEYRPSEIVYGGKRYILKEPLECVVRWDDEGGDFLWVEYNPLDIFGTGDTVDEAIELFSFTFADAYEYLNGVHRDPAGYGVLGLGDRLEEVRVGLNALVASVKLCSDGGIREG